MVWGPIKLALFYHYNIMFRKHGNKPRNLCNAGFGDSMLLCTVKIMLWTIWIETILHAARLSKLWVVLHWPLWWLQQEHLLSLLASIAERRIFASYMLNTDYTNNTNVFEWRLRKIRGIRDIRVPSNFPRGICWTRITQITRMRMNGVCNGFGRFA